MADMKQTDKRKRPGKTPSRSMAGEAPAEDLGRLSDLDDRTAHPTRLLIGEFVLDAVSYDDQINERTARRPPLLSGTAWLHLGCIRRSMQILDIKDSSLASRTALIRNRREVVLQVTYPQTQVSLQEAQKYKPDAAIGQSLEIPSVADGPTLPAQIEEGGVLVGFEVNRVKQEGRRKDTVRVIEGKAWYPVLSKEYGPLKVQYDAFTLNIKTLQVTPDGGRATIDLQLPDCLSDCDTCGPATLDLGEVNFSPTCEFSVQSPDGTFGPWIVSSSGLVVSGKGFVAQFPAPSGTTGLIFKGLILTAGEASGKDLLPVESNAGYLAGLYTFSNATVTSQGFSGNLTLSSPVSFDTNNPRGYSITSNAGDLKISQCRISSGSIKDGVVELPARAVCRESGSGRVRSWFSSLTIDADMDLSGEVHFDDSRICWGELCDPARQIAAWGATLNDIGYLYLPNGPRRSYCPDQGIGFNGISISYPVIPILKAGGIAGITVLNLSDAQIYSLDRDGGRKDPISFPWIEGWIHIDASGIDGEIIAIENLGQDDYNLGNPARSGYLGQVPFNSSLGPLDNGMLLGRFITSAVCDSNLRGRLQLPAPCGFGLKFTNMMATSTADLIGGNIQLQDPLTTYDYWRLELVSMGTTPDLGVLSIRTGRIILTAAGIQEKQHFTEPFRVTWEEIFPTGNIGEIFFSFNSSGQMFDKIPFSTHHLKLSEYRVGATDGYLAVAGTVHFDFFGPAYANIRDARNDAQPNAPFFKRKVTVQKADENGWEPTNLSIHGQWNAKRATFIFPDAGMDYHQAAQRGFIGSGTATLAFVNSPELEARVEIHSDAIDIRISTKTTHDVDVGLYARLGGIAELHGCARIEGSLLKRISIHGWLERSVATGTGILAPKAGAIVETLISVTPTSCTYAASGDMVISVGGTEVDVSGSAFLSIDYATRTAEGQFEGRINCNSAMVALEGEGQVTWYISPKVLAFQGSIMVAVNCWTGGMEMEGGIFLGYNVSKSDAWVLRKASPHYGLSDYLLPDTLTGVYGYGRIAFGLNFYIFGGGVEIFVGLGAFLDTPQGFPYFLGRGGFFLHGEILGGLVSAEGWATLQLYGPPFYFEGSLGLRGCVLWVLCASVSVTAGISNHGEFYLE